MSEQFLLALNGRIRATFDNFLGGEESAHLKRRLQQLSSVTEHQLLYLHGGVGAGKSHLLHALYGYLQQHRCRCRYLPLAVLWPHSQQGRGLPPLQELGGYDVVLLDDLDRVAGDPVWEEWLFHLLNQGRDRKQSLVVTAANPVAAIGVELPDLQSRLGGALVGTIPLLSDEMKWQVITTRAQQWGMVLSPEVVRYLQSRVARDFHSLIRLLERLDQDSLRQQRRITVPWVRQLLQQLDRQEE